MSSKHRLSMLLTVGVLVGVALAAAPPADAATVTGTLGYRDMNCPLSGTGCDSLGVRPIAFTWVQIWHRGIFFWNVWVPVGDAATDSAGSFTFTDGRSDGTYAVRVYAWNYAAGVWPNGVDLTPENGYHSPFFAEPGQPGPVIHRTVNSASEVALFDFTFEDAGVAAHFNIAEAIRHGFDYAAARRDPAEGDALTWALVTPTPVTGNPANVSWYNPLQHRVVLHSSNVFHDFLILHEYAHWLEAQLSSFAWLPSRHDGCTSTPFQTPEHAWMEGFADYFAQSVARFLPDVPLNGLVGTSGPLTLESPPSCTASTADAVENFVAASLWDLFDIPEDSAVPFSEPHDFVARADVAIFQIFDRELDMFPTWPTIWHFRNAWIGRGLDQPGLDRILSRHGILALPNQTAQFITQSVPTQMVPGQTYSVSVTMRNTGITTWQPWFLYRLGSQNPQDNVTWGTSRVGLLHAVSPGAQVTFDFTITAPSTAGTYNFQWRMLQDWVEWFGDFTANRVVTVGTSDPPPDQCFDPDSRQPIPC